MKSPCGFPGGAIGKGPALPMQETSLGWDDPLAEGTATQPILAWRILWTEELGWLQSMEVSKRLSRLSIRPSC